jgi:hypothetical protein
MADAPNNPEPKRARPAGKKSTARKPSPSLLPILESEPKPDREKFPLFLGASIAVSVAVLVIVAVLSFCGHKPKPASAAAPTPVAETPGAER